MSPHAELQSTAPMSVIARMEQSRARLRAAMLPPPAVSAGETTKTNPFAWLDRLKEHPAVAVVVDTLRSWWLQQPLRAAVHVASEAGNALARPIAQKNPIALVAVAAVLGAVLAWTRPWRWVIKPALFAGLLPQLVTSVVAKLPLETWLAVLSSAISKQAPPPQPARNSS